MSNNLKFEGKMKIKSYETEEEEFEVHFTFSVQLKISLSLPITLNTFLLTKRKITFLNNDESISQHVYCKIHYIE